MNQDSRSVNAKDFAFLASHSNRLWDELVGIDVEHDTYGRGSVSKVEVRPNYTPLITLTFEGVTKVWPPRSFESGKTRFWLNSSLAALVDTAAAELAAEEHAAAEAAKREAEELAALKEAALAEARRLARLTPEEKYRERMAALVERHKERLSRLGLPFKGIRLSVASRFHRVTYCYECDKKLDSSVDVQCVACTWMLCQCGACGCGYRKA